MESGVDGVGYVFEEADGFFVGFGGVFYYYGEVGRAAVAEADCGYVGGGNSNAFGGAEGQA